MYAPPPPQQHYPGAAAIATGKTPIAKRTRSSNRRTTAANDTTTTHHSAAAAPTNNNYNAIQPPPPQGMRNTTTDDAIAKRRAELRRLQQQRGKSAQITERLSQAASSSSRSGVSMRTATTMRGAVNTHNSNYNTLYGGSYKSGGNGSSMTANYTAEAMTNANNNGPPPPQKPMSNHNSNTTATSIPTAMKRTSEIFPPTQQRSTTTATTTSTSFSSSTRQSQIPPPKSTMTYNTNHTKMTPVGSNNNNSHQYPPPPTASLTTAAAGMAQQSHATPIYPPPSQPQRVQQQQQQQQQHSSPLLNPITSNTTTTTTTNNINNNLTKSPFGQARVTKVIPALSLTAGPNGGSVKSLVPPLDMLDVPSLTQEDDTKEPIDNKRVDMKRAVDTKRSVGIEMKSVRGEKSSNEMKSNIETKSSEIVNITENIVAPPPTSTNKSSNGNNNWMNSLGVANNTNKSVKTNVVGAVKHTKDTSLPPPIMSLPPKPTTTTAAAAATTTTPRSSEDMIGTEGEMINSGQSTPLHTNRMGGSPVYSTVGGGTAAAAVGVEGDDSAAVEQPPNGGSEEKLIVDGSGNETVKSLSDVSDTLQKAKLALDQEQLGVEDAAHSTTASTGAATIVDSSSKEVEKATKKMNNGQQPSLKREVQEEDKPIETTESTSSNNNNLSRLKLDLERSEKEKLEALEQVAKLKSLLEAGGIGANPNPNNNGETPRVVLDSTNIMSTIDTPRRTQSPRSIDTGITTPRGGNTPNRFTPNRINHGRVGIPPLAWGTPRSGNNRAGVGSSSNSRSGSPEHDSVVPPYGPGTPRLRASPLPKQLNRVVSDSQLNKSSEGKDDNGDTSVVPQQERVEEEFLIAAARSIPNEYGTPLASYFVRRPHVTDDSLERNETDELAKIAIDLWENKCTHLLSNEEYRNVASVFHPDSVEIVACIEADGSVFTLSGECNACHGKGSSLDHGGFDDEEEEEEKEYEWSVFENVEEMDRALGRVSYIDMEGNEREYWLDSIYEEALSTREAYCTSLISSAFTLKQMRLEQPSEQKKEQPAMWNQPMQSQPAPMQAFTPPDVTTIESNVKMSYPPMQQQPVPQSNANVSQAQTQRVEPVSKVEIPVKPSKSEPPTADSTTSTKSAKVETKQKQSPPPEEYEPSDSALTVMVVALFSVFFKLSWFIIKTPFRIVSKMLTFWIVLIALRVLSLYLADDNGAWDIGAGVEYEYNMPGIY